MIMDMTPDEKRTALNARASALGFDAVAIADAGPCDPEDRLGQWLGAGYHADMQWMGRTKELRQDASKKLSGARSVVAVAKSYFQERSPGEAGSAKVAMYAWGRDYHRVLIKPLRLLGDYVEELQPGTACYCSVDSGPVLERTWAEQAGLGWIGKNSLVLRRDMGSYFFLGTIITTAHFPPDDPVEDHCGSCRACIDACPTSAIVEAGVVDSARCISYQTIENRGEVPEALQPRFGDWLFGCDVCQEVCPWNRFAVATSEPDFTPRPGQANPDPEALAQLDEASFRARFAGTALMRPKITGLQRNARIVLRNRSRTS